MSYKYLQMVDSRIRGIRATDPNSSGIKYLQEVVRPDVISKMSEQDIKAYENRGLTAAEIEKKNREDLAAMESNKDSSSI